jgi:hypothetical protein
MALVYTIMHHNAPEPLFAFDAKALRFDAIYPPQRKAKNSRKFTAEAQRTQRERK